MRHPSRQEATAAGILPVGVCVDDSKCDGANCPQIWFYDEFLGRMFGMLPEPGPKINAVAKLPMYYPGWTARVVEGRRMVEHSSNSVERKRLWVIIDRKDAKRNATLGVWPD